MHTRAVAGWHIVLPLWPPGACAALERWGALVAREITRHIPVRITYLEQGWAGGGALLHGVWTPGTEATARRRIDRIWGIAHKRWTVEAFVRIQRGRRGKQ